MANGGQDTVFWQFRCPMHLRLIEDETFPLPFWIEKST
jgi:hypothetical protein